ncbi:malate dehydrogenase, cytoplasmic-like [Sus scrofa]|uniref:malate dehydrogenase, cytoplasmic-like n=1 Tax=Sus scrofa TaxID=9823 RepID=UPI000A2B4F77|nr:malate dehydrogenase, cytoplasmic-like [Sus scrofa]
MLPLPAKPTLCSSAMLLSSRLENRPVQCQQKAISDHIRDIWFGTPEGEFVSMGIISDGNSYGVPDDLLYSFPVTTKVRHLGLFSSIP